MSPLDHREELDLNALVEEASLILRVALGHRSTLELELGENLPKVWLPASDLKRILLNLVVNARDAMPASGLVTISTAVVNFDEDEAREQGILAGRYVRLVVADTGSGMTPSLFSRVWEERGFSTKGGKGVGLIQARALVERAGGAVDLHTQVGKGTQVELTLPTV